MSISDATVHNVSKLARIKITADECKQYKEDLLSILEIIDHIHTVDTENIEPMRSVTQQDGEKILRADEVTEVNIQEKILKNAPSEKYGYFTVPKMIE